MRNVRGQNDDIRGHGIERGGLTPVRVTQKIESPEDGTELKSTTGDSPEARNHRESPAGGRSGFVQDHGTGRSDLEFGIHSAFGIGSRAFDRKAEARVIRR